MSLSIFTVLLKIKIKNIKVQRDLSPAVSLSLSVSSEMLSLTGFHSPAVRVRLLLPPIFFHNWKTWVAVGPARRGEES